MPGAAAGMRWHVYTTRSLYVLTDGGTPTGPSQVVKFLGISRETGVAQEASDTLKGLQDKLAKLAGGHSPRPQVCVAVLGCLTAHSESFLILVTEAEVVADVDGKKIYQVGKCEALPISLPTGASSESPSSGSEAAMALSSVLHMLSGGFYFSKTFDVTRRLQRRWEESANFPGSEDLFDRADERYVWNKQMVLPLSSQAGVSTRWFSPILSGFVQMLDFHPPNAPSTGSSPPLALLLIARRSCRRAGTRYNARGVDDDGETGNWVEIEQLVKLRRPIAGKDGTVGPGWVSLVQVRGSAPIFWEQNSQLQGVVLTRGSHLGAVAFAKHHEWLKAEYGDVFYVNLLSQSMAKQETEGIVGSAFQGVLKMYKDIKHRSIDFGAFVTGEEARFDRELMQVAGEVSRELLSFGFLDVTSVEAQGSSTPAQPRKKQTGVLRTNCFDCLDRSNLLQQQLAWVWISAVFTAWGGEFAQMLKVRAVPAPKVGGGFSDLLGAFGDLVGGESHGHSGCPALQGLLRSSWADLSDALSMQYTGAASTWAGILRQGGRSALAVLEKGWNSMNRAYNAQFQDSSKQASLDLLLGKHKLPRAPGNVEARRAPVGQLVVATITWNVHCKSFWEVPNTLEELIAGACGIGEASSRSPDVVIFSFQEMIELTAGNVMTLASGDCLQIASFEQAAPRALHKVLGEPFMKVQGLGMVGLYCGAFVAQRLAPRVARVAVGRRAAKLYGQAGNKGAVAVRFEVCKTSLCAIAVHLESGTGAAKAKERVQQLRDVLLGRGEGATPLFLGAGGKDVPAITKHDLVIVSGDFNFRLSLPEGAEITGDVRDALQSAWPAPSGRSMALGEGLAGASVGSSVLGPFEAFDELTGDRVSQQVAEVLREASLMEGPVRFPATYRFIEGSTRYDHERTPAWCDRVLHSKVGVTRWRYVTLGGISGLMVSDHQPVASLLETRLLDLPSSGTPVSSANSQASSITARSTSGPLGAPTPIAVSLSPTGSPRTAGASTTPTPTARSLLGGGSRDVANGAADLLPTSPTSPVLPLPAAIGGSPPARPSPLNGSSTSSPGMDHLLGDSLVQTTPSPPQRRGYPPVAHSGQASPPMLEDPLSFGAGPNRSPSSSSSAPLPGFPVPPEGVQVGATVLAEHAGGWYFASVLRSGGGSCDVAWLRPSGATWHRDQHSERYFCSTGLDETCYGDRIPTATRIRLSNGQATRMAAAAAATAAPTNSAAQQQQQQQAGAVAAATATTAAVAGPKCTPGSGNNLPDLLGTEVEKDLLG